MKTLSYEQTERQSQIGSACLAAWEWVGSISKRQGEQQIQVYGDLPLALMLDARHWPLGLFIPLVALVIEIDVIEFGISAQLRNRPFRKSSENHFTRGAFYPINRVFQCSFFKIRLIRLAVSFQKTKNSCIGTHN